MADSSCRVGDGAIGGLCMSPCWADLRRWRVGEGVGVRCKEEGTSEVSLIETCKTSMARGPCCFSRRRALLFESSRRCCQGPVCLVALVAQGLESGLSAQPRCFSDSYSQNKATLEETRMVLVK